MFWTDEVTDAVKLLWLNGHSATMIGRQFGVTRNTIVGKASRMGWRREAATIPMRDSAKWTPDMDAVLRAHANAGATRSTAAADMGLTYNQVLSRTRTLGLKMTDGRSFVMADFSRVTGNGSAASAKAHHLGTAGAPARIVSEEPDPSITGLTVMQIPSRGACRWPLTGTGAMMLMCGQRCGDDVYCGPHLRVAYCAPVMSPARSQRNLERGLRKYA